MLKPAAFTTPTPYLVTVPNSSLPPRNPPRKGQRALTHTHTGSGTAERTPPRPRHYGVQAADCSGAESRIAGLAVVTHESQDQPPGPAALQLGHRVSGSPHHNIQFRFSRQLAFGVPDSRAGRCVASSESLA